VRRLDGECFVFSPSRAQMTVRGGLRYCPVISPALGALFQSQFYAEVPPGEASPVIGSDGRDVVLFVQSGEGEIDISGRRFLLHSLSGIYVHPAEAFRIENPGRAPVKLFISNGPGSEDLAFLDEMPANFATSNPNRRAEIDPAQRNGMGDRFYQMLINREHGSTVITQFIGNIPLSKGQPHRHLYEEALIFLRGTGVVWTETLKAEVEAGDVLFLPRKLLHSVQCTAEGGLDVVGLIYPGDNPSINY
jgi:mannose-6-phosphate isomerase-like protein (cupin superfamily)